MLLKSALRSLARNRLRTFFTVFSILIGVASFFFYVYVGRVGSAIYSRIL